MIEEKYINLVSGKLRNFKKKSSYTYNASCPYCGDSKTKQRKARFYIYLKKGKWRIYCHNCQEVPRTFGKFLESLDYMLYKEYVVEKKLNRNDNILNINDINFKTDTQSKFHATDDILSDTETIASLPDDHPAKKYVLGRKIPERYLSVLRYTPKFFAWVNTLIPEKFEETALKLDSGRVIIPFRNKNNEVHAVLGRSLIENDDCKYLLINLDDETPCVFGLNTVDFNKRVYVLEGPIDSLFVNNSLALSRLNFNQILNLCRKETTTIIFDNEPRSRFVKEKMSQALNIGYQICIWPTYIKSKDINKMILDYPYTEEKVKAIIDENTYKGLGGLAKITSWSKI